MSSKSLNSSTRRSRFFAASIKRTLCSTRSAVLAGGSHRDLDRIVQQFAGERANVGGHCRGEEQVLSLLGQFPNDASDWLDEAEVEHLIDFVEHQKLDRAETRDAGVEMIEKTAGCRDQHIEARLKRANLSAMRHAAEHDRDLQPKPVGQVTEALGDLAREFTRRAQHEHARAALWAPGAGRLRAG